MPAGDGAWLVAGQSLAEQEHIEGVLRDGEALAAPVLLLAMFAGSLIIGLRALSPVEQSRRRQLEFTADASHELRTPLSVIGAETGIALSAPRKAADYQAALRPHPGREPAAAPDRRGPALAGPVRLAAAAARGRAPRPGHDRRAVRRPLPRRSRARSPSTSR